MADFKTYFGETEDGGFYAFLDLTLPYAFEPGASGEGVLDTLDDMVHYVEEMRRAIRVLERCGGGVAVSGEYEDTLDVYFEGREDAEEALRALESRDLLDFLVEDPSDLVGDGDADPGHRGSGNAHLN